MNYHRFSDKYETTDNSTIPLNMNENTIVDSILIEYDACNLHSNDIHISLCCNDVDETISFDSTYCLINNKIHIHVSKTRIYQYTNRYKSSSNDIYLNILHDKNMGPYTVILYKKRYYNVDESFDNLTSINYVKITSGHDPMTGPYSSYQSIVLKYFFNNQEYVLWVNPMTDYDFGEISYIFDIGTIYIDKSRHLDVNLSYKDSDTFISYGTVFFIKI